MGLYAPTRLAQPSQASEHSFPGRGRENHHPPRRLGFRPGQRLRKVELELFQFARSIHLHLINPHPFSLWQSRVHQHARYDIPPLLPHQEQRRLSPPSVSLSYTIRSLPPPFSQHDPSKDLPTPRLLAPIDPTPSAPLIPHRPQRPLRRRSHNIQPHPAPSQPLRHPLPNIHHLRRIQRGRERGDGALRCEY